MGGEASPEGEAGEVEGRDSVVRGAARDAGPVAKRGVWGPVCEEG